MDREDWEDFDDLFMKEGYGGYYDFVECLRLYADAWSSDILYDDDRDEFLTRLRDAKTLRGVERLLMKLYYLHKKKRGLEENILFG